MKQTINLKVQSISFGTAEYSENETGYLSRRKKAKNERFFVCCLYNSGKTIYRLSVSESLIINYPFSAESVFLHIDENDPFEIPFNTFRKFINEGDIRLLKF